jgi:hypothetical protein
MLYSNFTKVTDFSGHCFVTVSQGIQFLGMTIFVTPFNDRIKSIAAVSHLFDVPGNPGHLGSRVPL